MTIKRLVLPIFIISFFVFPLLSNAASDEKSFSVSLEVVQESDGGGVVGITTPQTNPPQNLIGVCGNGICEAGEDWDYGPRSCRADCVAPVVIPGTLTCETDTGSECPGFDDEATDITDQTANIIDSGLGGGQDSDEFDGGVPVAPEGTTPSDNIVEDIPDIINNIIEEVAEFSENVIDRIIGPESFVRDLSESVVNSFESLGTDIVSFITDPVEVFVNTSNAIEKISRQFIESPLGNVVTNTTKAAGVFAGAAFVATQAILGTGMMTVASLSDVYLLLWKLVGILIGASKRRGKPWGTVYDSVTKRPLDPAYVVVSRPTGEEVADAITDLDGRYGFLIPPGTYRLKASKTNYSFPSKNLEGKNTDEIYSNIYHGEDISTSLGGVIVENIPLDPIGFDWNEFAKNKQNLFRIYSDRERFWGRIFESIYFIGLLSAFIAALFDPGPINFIFIAIYAVFVAYGFSKNRFKKATVVRRASDSMPIPYAVIKVFLAEVNTQVKTVVADHLGRFYFLVGPGRYYITVDEKQDDGTYKTIHKTEPIDLKTGVVNSDILI